METSGPPTYQELPATPAETLKTRTTPFTGTRRGPWVKIELPPFVGNVAEGRKVRKNNNQNTHKIFPKIFLTNSAQFMSNFTLSLYPVWSEKKAEKTCSLPSISERLG